MKPKLSRSICEMCHLRYWHFEPLRPQIRVCKKCPMFKKKRVNQFASYYLCMHRSATYNTPHTLATYYHKGAKAHTYEGFISRVPIVCERYTEHYEVLSERTREAMHKRIVKGVRKNWELAMRALKNKRGLTAVCCPRMNFKPGVWGKVADIDKVPPDWCPYPLEHLYEVEKQDDKG